MKLFLFVNFVVFLLVFKVPGQHFPIIKQNELDLTSLKKNGNGVLVETFFSKQALLPQTQTKNQLINFLSTEHEEYGLDGWFFFGNLIEGKDDTKIKDDQINSFFIAIQRMDVFAIPGLSLAIFPCIVGFNSPELEEYIYGGNLLYGINCPPITATSNPWSVTVSYPSKLHGPPLMMSMILINGKMGMKDAVYILSSYVEDQKGNLLQIYVKIKDVFGVVNQGYGSSSFFPQWVLPAQRKAIQAAPFNGSVKSYLSTKDARMTCQGSYYYSAPNLKVLDFKITKNNKTLAKGNQGKLWMDYIVQTYNDNAKTVINKCSWFFAAIQFSDNTSMMIFQLKTKTMGILPIANFFSSKGKVKTNGAISAEYCWDFDKISITPVKDSIWTSPTSHLEYYTKYDIILQSDRKEYNANLTVGTLINNQEICISGTDPKYEGIATVSGTLNSRKVKGYAWVELQPVASFSNDKIGDI